MSILMIIYYCREKSGYMAKYEPPRELTTASEKGPVVSLEQEYSNKPHSMAVESCTCKYAHNIPILRKVSKLVLPMRGWKRSKRKSPKRERRLASSSKLEVLYSAKAARKGQAGPPWEGLVARRGLVAVRGNIKKISI